MAGIGSTPALIVGTAVGGAAAAAFEPALEVPRQSAWNDAPNRLPDVGLLAALVAGGKITQASGRSMAARLGFGSGPFDSLTWLAQNRLDFPIMLRMWRLAAVNPAFDEAGLSALFDETLGHEQLDWKYQPYLRALKEAELVGLGDIAYGVVRGMLPAPSWVPVAPPTTTTHVKRFPQVDIDPVKLAAALGYDENMLKLMVGRSGLSMAPGMAAQANFRGILADDDFLLAVAEGDLRTEWADALKAVSREIPTAGQMVEHTLRGWADKTQMYAQTARHGMTQPDTDLIYQTTRRSLTPHQVKQALARGANFNPEAGELTNPYEASVHQNNLGPEWYELAIALQGSYPSLFQLNRLVTSGTITPATGADWAAKSGLADEVVASLEAYWKTLGGSAADPHVTKAQNHEWTTAQTSYINGESDQAAVQPTFAALGVTGQAQTEVLASWDRAAAMRRKQLTATQLKKALAAGEINPATGAAWTEDETLERLHSLGYSTNDAVSFVRL
jgi:hypothetical protein